MAEIKIEIKNLSQIKAAFNKAPMLMIKELNIAIQKTVLQIKGTEVIAYRSLGIRVVSGGLISSIQRGTFFSNLKGEVGPNVTESPGVDYAEYVHDGTPFMEARPFLQTAVDGEQDNTDMFFKTAVDNVLSAIGKSV